MRSTRSRRRHGEAIIALEARRLMSTSVTSLASQESVIATPPPVLANLSNASSNTIGLSTYFLDPNVPGTVAEFDTTEGNFDVALTDSYTPTTVANFLSYVNAGAYDSTFFHRSVVLSTNAGGSPTTPADIVQGGGYYLNSSTGITHINTNSPIGLETTTEQLDNVAGTIAMARTSDPNSATSEFYFNTSDNPDLDPAGSSDGNGYTTFGHVLGGSGNSFPVIDTLAALPTANISSSLSTVPVQGLTQAQVSAGSPAVTANNLVYINNITTTPGTTYTVTSSEPNLVTPSVADGNLSFTYASGKFGTSVITVVAKNLDGTSATAAFTVTVPDSANPTEGPTLVTTTSPAITEGTTATVNPLAGDTDGVAALNGSTVSIVTQPSDGTATFDPSTDLITYTPTAGFIGTDSLTYTVADTAGTTSSVGTLDLDVVAGPVQITIGNAGSKFLIFTEPSGQSGKLLVTGGTAQVTFASSNVTVTTAGGFVSAVGPGATITSIKYIAIRNEVGSISITSPAALTVGSISSVSAVATINAPTTTFTGTISIGQGNGGGLGTLIAAGLDGATLEFSGRVRAGAVIRVPTVVNSSINSTVNGGNGYISQIISNSWTVTDGGSHAIQATLLGTVKVPGTFADDLDLTGGGYDLLNGSFNSPTGSWSINGSIFHATVTNPTPSWNVSVGGIVQQLNVTGTFSSTIQAAAINKFNIKGSMSGAVVQTDETYSKKLVQLGSLSVSGAITNSVVFAAGNVGTISAGSYSGSRIYAGIEQSIAQNAQLPTDSTSYTAQAKINAVVATSPKSTFADTLISAESLGTLRLGVITTGNSGTAFGVAGTIIGSVSGTLSPATRFAFGKAQLKSASTLAAYITSKNLTLGDFGVDIISA
jgi:peptidyl-prolyl cis-trans isomerase A (cyclophilin A)